MHANVLTQFYTNWCWFGSLLGKILQLLACMQDESVTYASTSRDLIPPVDYEDPSPLLTPEPLSDRDEPDGMPAPPTSSSAVIVKQCSSTANIVNTHHVTPSQV